PEPRRLRAPGGGDRLPGVLARAAREGADEDLVVDGRADLERAVPVPLRPVDEVAVDLPEAALRLLEPLLVTSVQLLVVGPQRGVRDRHRRGHSQLPRRVPRRRAARGTCCWSLLSV